MKLSVLRKDQLVSDRWYVGRGPSPGTTRKYPICFPNEDAEACSDLTHPVWAPLSTNILTGGSSFSAIPSGRMTLLGSTASARNEAWWQMPGGHFYQG